jgi:hypothetical protein
MKKLLFIILCFVSLTFGGITGGKYHIKEGKNNKPYISKTTIHIKKLKIKDNNSKGTRIGNIAKDGTVSSAAGRGAGSHHGGVKKWIHK